MQKAPYYLLLLLSFFSSACFSQHKNYSEAEKKSISLFDSFISYINECIKNKTSITDPDSLKQTLPYLFTNSKLDSANTNKMMDLNELPDEKMKNLKAELNSLYRYQQEREDQKLAENLRAIPMRLVSDTCIYNKLTLFQKENTLAFYDMRQPKKTLGYMLIMPAMKGITTEPKIWSWTLVFQFGKYVFQSVTGQLGYEYIFTPEEFKKEQKKSEQ